MAGSRWHVIFFDLCTDVIYEEKGKTIHLRKEELK